ncbi:MAG: hypothetical protein H6Q17_1830 [Bacteroidetes bacterium]|nr:hypothetical protein [Bacteroidota bacterium]
MSKDFHDLVINLLGGVLVAVLDRLIIFLNAKFKSFKFKQIFGNDLSNFNLVYGKMVLKPQYVRQDKFPYLKPSTNKQFSINNPVSFAETRAASYMSESFSKFINKNPQLISDDEVKNNPDISYCSLGGYDNFKTIEIIESIQNEFLEFNLQGSGSIVNKKDKKHVYKVDGTYDYAVVIKIKHRLFPNRTHICVAGLGEWGTSGGTWFLANKWKELQKKVGDKNFGAVIKIKGGTDKLAELVEIIK